MKVTKHGFTYTENTPDEVHLCPECNFSMERYSTRDNEKCVLSMIKWDRHYDKFRCNGCGCEGEVKRGFDNIRIRDGVIQMIVTVTLSTILHVLLWYWIVWYDKTYDPGPNDDTIEVQVALLVILAVLTIVSVAKAIGNFQDDDVHFMYRKL